jgi:hypothetical protein
VHSRLSVLQRLHTRRPDQQLRRPGPSQRRQGSAGELQVLASARDSDTGHSHRERSECLALRYADRICGVEEREPAAGGNRYGVTSLAQPVSAGALDRRHERVVIQGDSLQGAPAVAPEHGFQRDEQSGSAVAGPGHGNPESPEFGGRAAAVAVDSFELATRCRAPRQTIRTVRLL